QRAAKRAVAIALRNRWRRQQVPDELRDEILPKNIILIGPTGVGKTEVARRLAKLARAPFVKVEASKFTEVGYVGRDVESMIRDLAEVAIEMVRQEEQEKVRTRAREAAEDRVLELLPADIKYGALRREVDEASSRTGFVVGAGGVATRRVPRDERALRRRLRSGEFDEVEVELEVATGSNPLMQVFTNKGSLEEMDMSGMLGNIFPQRKARKRFRVAEALGVLEAEEADQMIDMDRVVQDALKRAEQDGIIFLDEVDKVATRQGAKGGPDVSREGVQRDLLPIVEGSSVRTKHGVLKTDHVLFVAAGAFHVAKPSDLIPELQGRFPIRVELDNLTEEDFVRILTEPRNALVKQYTAMMATEDVALTFTEDAIAEMASIAAQVNRTLENIGARRLHTIMERLLDEVSFVAPEMLEEQLVIDRAYVRKALAEIAEDTDLSRYIL
ncbi:MAG: ATP-dependent protease ATPase subunit HslU, partial [Myxococcota bacterium]